MAPFDPANFAIFNPLALASDDQDGLARLYREKYGEGEPKFKKLSALFMDPATFWQPDIRKLWNIRVALGRQRSALEGQLFGFSALAAGSKFMAGIICEDDAAEDLNKLLKGRRSLRIGHARSAGYGLAAIEAAWREEKAAKPVSGEIFNIFLESPYLPSPIWEEALANLKAALEAEAGEKAEVEKTFISHIQIEGFNGHWRRWRDSRPGLAAGSVIRLKFAKPVELAQKLALGDGRLEGYGRILVDPPFLKEARPEIQPMRKAKPEKAAAPINTDGPIWRILRDRALARFAEEQARGWLADVKWTKFLEKAASLPRPGASQRANAMGMNKQQFVAMLDKTPGQQWKNAVCPNPFGKGQDSLDAIMLKLLSPEDFLMAFPVEETPTLPGGTPTEAEIKAGKTKAHAMFKRELIRAWTKYNRIGEKAGGGE